MLSTTLVPEAEMVEGRAAAKDLLWTIQNIPTIAADTETTGLLCHKDHTVFWSMSEGTKRWCLDRAALPIFKPFLEDPKRFLVFHDANYDSWMLKNSGVDLSANGHRTNYRRLDTMVMHSLLENHLPHDLKYLCKEWLGVPMKTFRETFDDSEKDTGAKLLKAYEDNPEKVINYASLDAWATYKLYERFTKELDAMPAGDGSMLDYYMDIEFKMTEVLWQMERRGVRVDVDYIAETVPVIEEEMARLKKKLARLAGKVININSHTQVRSLVFNKNAESEWVDDKGKTPVRWTGGGKSGNRLPSTDDETMEMRAADGCPFAKVIQEYRSLSKTVGTNLIGYLRVMSDAGLLHTRYTQHVASTGRLSCLAPWCLVQTKRGEFPISEVLVGDDVWTHKNRWRKVQDQWPTGTRDIYDVRLSNGTVLTCTNNHQLLTSTGQWLSLQEIMDERIKAVGLGQVQRGNSTEWVQRHTETANDAGPGPTTWDHLSQCAAHPEDAYARGGAEGPESTKILSVKDRHQESHERESWASPPQLERALQRRVRVHDVPPQRETSIRSQAGNGTSSEARAMGSPTDIGHPPHRRGQVEQRSGQPCLSDETGTYEYPLLASKGNEVIAIEAINPSGSCTVYDLTVEEDHSYLSQGVFSHNSKQPNLQNVPSADKDKWGIRKAFIAKDGYKIGCWDYGQLEMRIAASLAGEDKMISAILDNRDMHAWTAFQMFGVDYDEVIAAKKMSKEELTEQAEFLLRKRGEAKCFHPDVEVLTKSGWKRILALGKEEEVIQAVPGKWGSTKLEWAVPTEVFSANHPSRKLVKLNCLGMDLEVTPDHRMLVWGGRGENHQVVMPEEINKARYWANSGVLVGESLYDLPESLLRIAVAVQADGNISNGGIRLGFSRTRKIERMRELLSKSDLEYSVIERGEVTTFRIFKNSAVKVLEALDGKSLSWEWLGLPLDKRIIVLEEAKFWDGTKYSLTAYRYDNTDKQSVDVLQAMGSITEHKTRIRQDKDGYHLSVNSRGKSRGGSASITVREFTDEVACLSVPSTFVLVRQNGVPVITGQTVGFGTLYGEGPEKLGKQLGLDKKEAKAILRAYFRGYPCIGKFFDEVKEDARDAGYATTPLGRRAYKPNIRSDNWGSRGEGERSAGNHPIQGFAAEITKRAQIRIFEDDDIYDSGVRMILQVHDEIVADIPHELVGDKDFEKTWCNHMAFPFGDSVQVLDVPLAVDGSYADSWGDAK